MKRRINREGNTDAANAGGFTLVELMIAVAIIATLSGIAVPKYLNARVSSNENTAIATLRTLVAAQAQFQSSCAVDTNADGGGDYGYFGEMAGVAPLRQYDALTNGAGIGVDYLDPEILPTPFDEILTDANGDGVARRAGYYFKVFLPGAFVGGVTPGIAESGVPNVGGGVAGNLPDAADGEILWCCYAWPVDAGRTGSRAFFVNQSGEPLQYLNQNRTYSGITNAVTIPSFDAAYSNETGGGDMNAELGLTTLITSAGFAANDGNTWTTVGN